MKQLNTKIDTKKKERISPFHSLPLCAAMCRCVFRVFCQKVDLNKKKKSTIVQVLTTGGRRIRTRALFFVFTPHYMKTCTNFVQTECRCQIDDVLVESEREREKAVDYFVKALTKVLCQPK